MSQVIFSKALASVGIFTLALCGAAANEPRPAYQDPEQPSLPVDNVTIDLTDTALVVVDPQIDFLSPVGAAYGAVGKSIEEHDVVDHVDALFDASIQSGLKVFVSPHYYYPHDHSWQFKGSLEKLMHGVRMVDRPRVFEPAGDVMTGADWLPQYATYIDRPETIVTSPHKIYGPEQNDLVLQLRKQGIDKVILAGMSANLCVQAHLQELLEQGFEVIVVRDATAGAILPEGDGYLAALINFRFMANEVVYTSDIVRRIKDLSSDE